MKIKIIYAQDRCDTFCTIRGRAITTKLYPFSHISQFIEIVKHQIRDTYSETDRLKYLYEKCFEYDSPPNTMIPMVEVKINEIYGVKLIITQHSEITPEKEEDNLPF
jgi:hypothetical protein